jgi:hypothetical protein
VSLNDSRAQGLGDTSFIPKDRGKQLEGRKEEEKRGRRGREKRRSLLRLI